MPASATALRDSLRRLLDPRSPADALASYYIFHHDARRTDLFITLEDSPRPEGFLVRARTGQDLFRPLVTFRAPTEDAALDLFRRGLQPGRPFFLAVPEALSGWANKHLQVTDAALLRLLVLDSARFEPIINVLTVSSRSPEGWPRFEIRSGDNLHAAAGLNWRSPDFAEIYVYTEAAARQRGWGKSVVSAVVGQLLGERVKPLYVVEDSNNASLQLAESVGFVDTGVREYTGQGVWANE